MTPAIERLRELGIAHEILEYDHDPDHPSYGEEAAEALGVEADCVFKTLLVTLGCNQVTKRAVGRHRPYTYSADAPSAERSSASPAPA